MGKKKPKFEPAHHTIKDFEPYRIHEVRQEGKWIVITTEADENYSAKTIKIRGYK